MRNWKTEKLACLEKLYGERASEWSNIYPPVDDDRRVYINTYNAIVEGIKSLPDEPNTFVRCAVNKYLVGERKLLERIAKRFAKDRGTRFEVFEDDNTIVVILYDGFESNANPIAAMQYDEYDEEDFGTLAKALDRLHTEPDSWREWDLIEPYTNNLDWGTDDEPETREEIALRLAAEYSAREDMGYTHAIADNLLGEWTIYPNEAGFLGRIALGIDALGLGAPGNWIYRDMRGRIINAIEEDDEE